MPKLLMKSGKFVNPDVVTTAWEVQANQVQLLHAVYIGSLYAVLDTAQGVIEWDIPMTRLDGTGSPGDLIVDPAEIAPFG